MRNILVVDDEAIHRRGLYNMLHSIDASFSIDLACDGEEACSMVEQKNYELIFADIKMPFVDGLEFIDKKIHLLGNSKVVIVSGYGEFEYAQKAIRLGAFDYLLKPLSKSKIMQVLEKVDESFNEEKISAMEKKLLEDKVNLTLPVYMQNILTMLIKGRLTEHHRNEILDILPENQAGSILIFKINPIQQDVTLTDSFWQDVKFRIHELLKQYGSSIDFRPIYNSENQDLFVSIFFGDEDNAIFRLRERDNLSFRLKALEQTLKASIKLAVSKVVSNVLAQGKEAYFEAFEAIESSFYEMDARLFFCDTPRPKLRNNLDYSKNLLNKVAKSIRDKDAAFAELHIEQFFSNMLQIGYIYPKLLKSEVANICIELIKSQKYCFTDSEYSALTEQITEKIEMAFDYGTLKSIVLEIICELIRVSGEPLSESQIRMKKILYFIEENIHRDISQEEIANLIDLQKSYFSTFFKSSTGMRFSDYLVQKRIELAKTALLESDEKIYKIAHSVGYNAPEYFNKVFRKLTGFSPEEYRSIYRG